MVFNYIIEICVAIDVAILGIAYPIIIDKTSHIGERYSSNYLSVIFNKELPQKPISFLLWKDYKVSFFKLILYLTILSFLLLIFSFEPLFGWDNWFINNSAKLIVFLFTVILTVSFFLWLDQVHLYNGKPTSLLKHVINRYKKSQINNEDKTYYLKTINEFAFYAISKQDEHIQKTLLEFYHGEFYRIRREHEYSEPLIYPVDLYFLVNKLVVESINNDKNKLLALENRAVSGLWLLGEEYEETEISETTYSWLWRNIYLICENDKYIKTYWGTAHQYFNTHLPPKEEDYDFDKEVIKNKEESERRDRERERFIEFHYALGGLLLYKKQYETIKYVFTYSQSIPPDYVLLPDTMHEIFKWFNTFNDNYSNPIDLRYPFPGLDNLGNSSQINAWICRYISLLFIRQFTLHKYYTFHDFTGTPHLPDNINELNSWLDNLSYFRRCLEAIISNEPLLKELNYDKIVSDKNGDIDDFLTSLEDRIKEKIGNEKLRRELSPEKISKFKTRSKEIINNAFSEYKNVLIPCKGGTDNDLKIPITGAEQLMEKSAFTDDDIPVINFDSAFASFIVSNKIKRLVPEAFFQGRTKRYLLNKNNFLKGIDIIINKKNNYIIIGFNINYNIKQQLDKYKVNIWYPPYTKFSVQDTLIILSHDNLPCIQHEKISEDIITENRLELIDENLKLYASVIDLSKEENKTFKTKWYSNEDEPVLSVQLALEFNANLYWKKNREVIQIDIATDLKEQGIENSLNEIEPLNK